MTATCRITVDGRTVDTRPGAMLLDALRAAEVDVPTLCAHPSVPPGGACRLCSVEISHADWGGWSGLVTSCLYPVEEGLVVSTRSERVTRTRRTLLELYLARCPDSPEIAALARAEGIDVSAFASREDADRCILCGLCTRVCQNLSTAAIAPLGWGPGKSVGPRPDGLAEDCVGCRACAFVCPTDAIPFSQGDGELRIWQREFAQHACAVEVQHCRACGICEEVCPTDIPRIAPRVDGTLAATISAASCEGCGICAGSCPTGAITQPIFEDAILAARGRELEGRALVYACARSDFACALPEGTEFVPVPCVGRVSPAHLVEALAAGADGALLMCRDRESCPHGEGGRLGEARARITSNLASQAGLGEGRVTYLRPEPGVGGPARSASAWRALLEASPLQEIRAEAKAPGGLDRALDLLRQLGARPDLALFLEPLGVKVGGAALESVPADFRFRISQDERRALAARLAADPEGTRCREAGEYLQLALLAREGAWQQGPCVPPRFTPEEVNA